MAKNQKTKADEVGGRAIAVCDCNCVHEEVLQEVQAQMDKDTLKKVAKLYSIFGDGTRLHILAALNCHEMCVCDLAVLMDMTKSATSHQLRVLRDNKLVTSRREGKQVFYSLADDHVKDLLDIAMDHIHEEGCEHDEKVHGHRHD